MLGPPIWKYACVPDWTRAETDPSAATASGPAIGTAQATSRTLQRWTTRSAGRGSPADAICNRARIVTSTPGSGSGHFTVSRHPQGVFSPPLLVLPLPLLVLPLPLLLPPPWPPVP